MASSGKKKTTMAKLNRESRMRERRLDKQARKDARKLEAARVADGPEVTLTGEQTDESAQQPEDRRPEAVAPALVDA
jgi:hypothetical protein